MTGTIACNPVQAYDSAEATRRAGSRFVGGGVKADGPIPVDVHVRTHNPVTSTDASLGVITPGFRPLAVGVLLDCYM